MREQKMRRLKALGRLGEERVEPEDNSRARRAKTAETDGKDSKSLCNEVFSKENIERAIYSVQKNKGAPGIDGMTVFELEEWWKENGKDEERFIRELHYRPEPVRKVKIPKPNGGERELGIPTVKDRMIQQAVLQVISPLVDPTFSEHSYGFRPQRSAHQAIEQARKYFEEGFVAVVDIDLKSYFDTVNHDILMRLVEEKGITCKVVLHIIRRSLMAGIMDGGLLTQRVKGTPQGGPLSPLLSNIYLDVLDKEHEARGHAFVRYADDVNIYVKSTRAGERVMQSATKFLETKLRLTVNTEKSEVGNPEKLKFLGFSLGTGAGEVYIRVHPASVKRLKDKLRKITRRNRGIALTCMLDELKRALTGWINYYGICRCKGLCGATDIWLRRRIRQFLWRQWKTPSAKRRNLIKLGINKELAYMWSHTRKSSWRIAGTAVLHRSLTNECLSKLGLFSMQEHYMKKCEHRRTATCGTA